MKKVLLLAMILALTAASAVFAAGKAVAAGGIYTGYMTCGADGRNRSVVIINTNTGDFEVFDVDNKGLDRKENMEYYDCVSYSRDTKTRIIYKYLPPQ